jgi:hypothetical protein
MRTILILWAAPLGLFWGWYLLSANDMHFGYVFLTRDVNDMVFQLYGDMVGIDPATIPALVAKACIFDSFLLGGILAFRRRRQIAAWSRQARERYLRISEAPQAGPIHPAE